MDKRETDGEVNSSLIMFYLREDFIFFFKSSFMFTVKLRERYRDFQYIPALAHASPLINISHQNATFVIIDEPILHIIITQSL